MEDAVVKGEERRRCPRVQVNRPGRIRVGNGPESNTQLIDISESGAALFYSSPVAIGTAIELRFHLNIGIRTACVVHGKVRHYSSRGESHVLGMEFTDVTPETAAVIRQFIQAKLDNVTSE